MKKLTFVYSLLLFCYQSTMAQINERNQDYIKLLNEFKGAEVFFFETLKENFGKTDSENILIFFNKLKQSNQNGYDFKLQLNIIKYQKLNQILESKYCDLFPFYNYTYDFTYKDFNIDYIKANEEFCDTLQLKIPRCENCKLYKESPFNVYLKESFKENMITFSGDFEEILNENFNIAPYVSLFIFYDRILLLYQHKENKDKLELTLHQKQLLTLLFWKYISFCANYDLEVMKYTYENR